MTVTISIVWRISSEKIEEIIEKFKLKPCAIFKKGELRRSKVFKESSMNVPVFDGDMTIMNRRLKRFFTAKKEAMTYFKRMKIKSGIDIGIIDISPDVGEISLFLEPEIMGLFNKYDIGLVISQIV